jgi:hypothetical protein
MALRARKWARRQQYKRSGGRDQADKCYCAREVFRELKNLDVCGRFAWSDFGRVIVPARIGDQLATEHRKTPSVCIYCAKRVFDELKNRRAAPRLPVKKLGAMVAGSTV